MVSRKHLKNKEFTTIKQLLDVGLSHRQITDITGRSNNTIMATAKAKDFDDYKQLVRARAAKYRSSPNPSVDFRSEDTTVSLLREINETLRRIEEGRGSF